MPQKEPNPLSTLTSSGLVCERQKTLDRGQVNTQRLQLFITGSFLKPYWSEGGRRERVPAGLKSVATSDQTFTNYKLE